MKFGGMPTVPSEVDLGSIGGRIIRDEDSEIGHEMSYSQKVSWG
jgi:hypothetical protein